MEPQTTTGSFWAYAQRSLQFVAPFWGRITFILAMTLLSSAIGAVEPLLTKYLFDGLTKGAPVTLILYGVGAMFILSVFHEVRGGIMNWYTWKARIDINLQLQATLVDRLNHLPLSYHQEEGVGRIMTRLDRGVNGFIAAFWEIAFGILPTIAYLAISLVAMFKLHTGLSLMVIAFTPLPALIGMWAAKEQTERERTLMECWSNLYSRFNEVLTGILTVKSFAREEDEKNRFLRGIRTANDVVVKGIGTDSLVGGAKSFTVTLARLSATAYGGYLVITGEITVGTLLAFLAYIGAIFGPVQGLTNVYQTIRKASVAMETIFSILDAHDPIGDRPDAIPAPAFQGNVRFRQMSFSYTPDKPVFRGLDLDVEAGEQVALVGPSGVGKTTLMALLQRLREPSGGTIEIDGYDIRTLEQRTLRRQIGIVLQDSLLFNDSIASNIAYGRPEATREEIEEAARAANAHDFIMELPDGYETLAGERGNRLSAGQRQRVAIARALLVDPPILILDEATSALDAESESLIQEALARLMKGRTTFVIAHRLSTVVDADRIVVLQNGEIQEMGTHDELIAANGYYARLVQKQTEGLLQAA